MIIIKMRPSGHLTGLVLATFIGLLCQLTSGQDWPQPELLPATKSSLDSLNGQASQQDNANQLTTSPLVAGQPEVEQGHKSDRLHLKFRAQSQLERHLIRNEAHLQIARNMELSQEGINGQPGVTGKSSNGRLLMVLNSPPNESVAGPSTSTSTTSTTSGLGQSMSILRERTLNDTKRKGRDELANAVDLAIVYSDPEISEWLYGTDSGASSSSATATARDKLTGIGEPKIEQIGSLVPGRPQQIRFKLAPSSQTATGITVPPLWRTLDVVAENYTNRKVVDEVNIFAVRLLHQTNREKLGNQNLVQPPFAIYKGLALLSAGAHGDTAKELDRVLVGTQAHFDHNKLTHDPDRRRLMASLGDVLDQLHSSALNHYHPAGTSGQLSLLNYAESVAPSSSSIQQQQQQVTSAPTLLTKDDQLTGFSQASNFQQLNQQLQQQQDDLARQEQYLIVANNLLFSPRAYQIAPEFKQYLASYHNETSLTRVETGSLESIQVVNGWIRRATQGMIPYVMRKKDTFDEYNVMSLMATSWLKQSWQDTFYRISSSLRSNIRLKGQGQGRALNLAGSSSSSLGARNQNQNSLSASSSVVAASSNPVSASSNLQVSDKGGLVVGGSSHYYSILRPGNLMEFVDDKKESHFVEYIISRPTQNIQHYRTLMNGFTFELVSVPFANSNHRWIALMPIASPAANISTSQQITDSIQKILMEPHIVNDPIDPMIIPISNSTNRLSNVYQQQLKLRQQQPITTNGIGSSSGNLIRPPSGSILGFSNQAGSGQQPGSSQAADLPGTPGASSNSHNNNNNGNQIANETDSSLLTKFLAAFADNPNKSMKLLWNLVAPEIITRQIMKNIQVARQMMIADQLAADGQSSNQVQSGPQATLNVADSLLTKNTADDNNNNNNNLGQLQGQTGAASNSNNQQQDQSELLLSGQYPLIQLSIPVIRSEADTSLVAELNQIGLVNAFDPSQANFIGINGHPFNYNELYLSNVLAKITFNLDENGVNHDRTIKSLEPLRAHPNRRQHEQSRLKLTKTKLIESSRKINEVKLNRPFIWFTVDIKTRLILLTGIVRNPNELTA